MTSFRNIVTCVGFIVASLFVSSHAIAKPDGPPTFNKDIATIVHDNCTGCHRPGESAPFPLITYEDVARRSRTIQRVIAKGYMPPWKAQRGHLKYAGERGLTDAEKALIDAWVDAGKPEGDPANKPTPPSYPSGWTLGEPDLVVKMPAAYNVPADGPDIYRWFVLPIDLPEDRWIKALDFRPSARNAVHHSLVFVDSSKQARKLDAKDPTPGFRGMRANVSTRIFGYAPGERPAFLPGDLAQFLPRGSDLVLQTHFHPTGKPEVEQSEVAIYFADKAPARPMFEIQVPHGFGRAAGINIPAGDANYVIEESFKIPADVVAWEVSGHAHYLCREMELIATYPDGTKQPLLIIDDWDLDWQDDYQLAEPLPLPAGTVVSVKLRYDNSADNPLNPFSPPRRVKWGIESTDEMGSMSVIVTAVDAAGTDTLKKAYREMVRASNVQAIRRRAGDGLLDRFDKNNDGKLVASELPGRFRRHFGRFDGNSDGFVDREELETTLLEGVGRR